VAATPPPTSTWASRSTSDWGTQSRGAGVGGNVDVSAPRAGAREASVKDKSGSRQAQAQRRSCAYVDYVPRRPPFSATAPRGNVLIEEVTPDKSSRAAGQVFEPYRPHKSLHVLGRRLKTKVLVTGLEVTRRPDMPSKSVGGRKPAGGFDSRPPPLPKSASQQRRSGAGREAAAGKARPGPQRPRPPHKSFGVSFARPGQVFRPTAGGPDKSSAPPLEGEVGAELSAPTMSVRLSGSSAPSRLRSDRA